MIGSSATFSIPSTPGDYNNRQACSWGITVPCGYRVQLTFQRFQTESGHDYLKIFDGPSGSSSQLAHLSGSKSTPLVYNSTGISLWFYFHTDYSVTRPGFNATFVAVSVCPNSMVGSSGSFTSPNYPSNYLHSKRCSWGITVPCGYRVQLAFQSFQTEYFHDYLEIYDGPSSSSHQLAYLSGSKSTPLVYLSTGISLWFYFHTDHSVTEPGFNATFMAVSECPTSKIGSSAGSFSSPNYPSNYFNNERCSWGITVPSGYRVEVNFSAFYTFDANDFLKIYDGSSSSSSQLTSLSGQQSTPRVYLSSGSSLWLEFSSDGSGTQEGFHATFTAITSSGCPSSVRASSGSFSSPNYPSNYVNNQRCYWGITVPGGYRVKLTLSDFYTYNTNDLLNIFDGPSSSSSQLASLSGQQSTPRVYSSSGSSVWLQFSSDGSGTEKGFHATFTSVTTSGCPPSVRASSGAFSSPNYPRNYLNNQRCAWGITVPSGYRVEVTFDAFYTYNSNDPLYIYDGPSSSRSQLASLSGQQSTPRVYSSSGSSLWLEFSSDGSGTQEGFNATFTAVTTSGCPFTVNGGFSGSFSSPYYPSDYTNGLRCSWGIMVPSGYRVEVTFDTFNTEDVFDLLRIFDGPNTSSITLASLSGYKSSSVIFQSSGSSLWFQFFTNGEVSKKGFHATYKAERHYVSVAPPHILKLKNATKNVTIDCHGYGKPSPAVVWKKDGAAVKEVPVFLERYSNQVVQVVDYAKPSQWNVTNRLYLRPDGVTYMEGGNYTCEVLNRTGANYPEEQSIEVLFPPWFLQEPHSKMAIEATNVTFVCNVSGFPRPTVVWSFNGSRLLDKSAPSGRLNLLGVRATSEYEGNYTCAGSNRAGVVSKTVTLSVHAVPVIDKVEAKSSTSIEVTWQKPTSGIIHKVTGYKLMYRRDGEPEQGKAVQPSETTIILRSLSKWTRYFLRIIAITGGGLEPSSMEKSTWTQEDVPSHSPSNVTHFVLSSTSVRVSWQLPPEGGRNGIITGFKIKHHQKNSSSLTSEAINNNATLDFTLNGLSKFTDYVYQVLAFTSKGDGPASLLKSFKTPHDAPSEPRTITVQLQPPAVGSRAQVTLTWSKPTEENGVITGYEIYYSENTVAPGKVTVQTVDPATFSWSFPVLGGTTYSLAVRANTIRPGPKKTITQVVPEYAPPPLYVGNVLEIETEDTSVDVTLWQASNLHGQISSYQIIVLKTAGKDKDLPSTLELADYASSQDKNIGYYVAAYISPESVDWSLPFTVGDGKSFGGYENVNLKKGERYTIYEMAAVSKDGKDDLPGKPAKIALVKVVGGDWLPSSVVVLGIFFPITLILIVVVVCLTWRLRKNSKFQAREAQREKETDQPKVYMELQFKDTYESLDRAGACPPVRFAQVDRVYEDCAIYANVDA